MGGEGGVGGLAQAAWGLPEPGPAPALSALLPSAFGGAGAGQEVVGTAPSRVPSITWNPTPGTNPQHSVERVPHSPGPLMHVQTQQARHGPCTC